MTLFEELAKNGVNVRDGLERLMNKESIYESLLKKFPDSISQREVLSYIEAGDLETAIFNAHTIKGVTANLGMTILFTAYTQIVDLLRAGSVEEAKKALKEIQPVQEKIISIINTY